jgi:hypothetical protein
MRRSILLALTLALLIATLGCSENKTFKVVFANLLPAGHDIECYANGNLLGTVGPNTTREFSWETRRLQTVTGPDPAYEAAVVFTARDIPSGLLSHEIRRTVSTDRTEYVEVNNSDF